MSNTILNNVTKLDGTISEKLFPYQIDHTLNLIHILKNNINALDTSDTGTGKTYTAIAVCSQLKMIPIIICPKSVISSWKKVCAIFKLTPLMIVNYENIKNGKYYVNGVSQKCPYIKIINNKSNGKVTTEYKWILNNKNIIFIFDEVHRCFNLNTFNGKLLYYAKNEQKNMLLLSATIADNPEKFKLFFYILNFIEPKNVIENNISFNQYMNIMHRWLIRDSKPMIRIHNMLYPNRSSRMRIDVLGDLFPKTQIIAQPYTIEINRQKQIEKEYKNISLQMELLKKKNHSNKNMLSLLMRSHQKIELLKIPIFVELANDFIENKISVVIFVNFTQTLLTLSKMLHTDCLIYGEQTLDARDSNIDKFQTNKSKIIICNIKAGGIGISLDDQIGDHPRASLISPTWDAVVLIQALGRIHRAGSKSKSLQRIIYTANTVEEQIAEKLQKKLRDINSLNNGDVDLTNITFEKERIKI